MSQETTEERLKALLDDPRTGLKDSSDSNKTRYAILALIDEGVQAHTDRVVEAIEKTKREPKEVQKYAYDSFGNRQADYEELEFLPDDKIFNQGIDTSIQIVKNLKI